MKKFLTIVFILMLAVSLNPGKTYSQTGNNVVLEFCTGTWCGYCPCGEEIIHSIKQNIPGFIAIAYHGAGSDPWQSYSSGIRSLMGLSSYPTGTIGRRTGIISRSAWYNEVYTQSNTIFPGVSINLVSKNYDASTRQLDITADITANATLTGDYFINFIFTEDNLVYPQTYYASCGFAGSDPNYIHDDVVFSMVNGDLGEALNQGGTWANGQTIQKSLNFTVPQSNVAENSHMIILIYKSGGSLTSNSFVMQAEQTPVDEPTSIDPVSSTVQDYKLSQNFPNPFNPTTSIVFSIPKDGNASLKFYDILGNEVATYVDGFLKAGTYNATFDGSNLATGIYFYTLSTSEFSDTKKMILTK